MTQEQLLFNGQTFSSSSGWITNAASGNFPMSIFNPASSLVIVHVIAVWNGTLTTDSQIDCFHTTTDPAYAQVVTRYNQLASGANSVSPNVTYRTTSTAITAGDSVFTSMVGANRSQDMFLGNHLRVGYLLPPGHGLLVWHEQVAAGKWFGQFVWREV